MIRTFIIDDHPMLIAGITAMLEGSAVVEVVGTATNAETAMAELETKDVEVVLTDINLGGSDGITLCSALKKWKPALKVLGLSSHKERSFITRMIEAGASGYLLKNASKDELEQGIIAAWRGQMYISQEATEVLTSGGSTGSLPVLTSREKEVLSMISDGMTNQEIADALFVSPLTVDSHRKNLLAKFGVKNTAQMVKVAIENHLL